MRTFIIYSEGAFFPFSTCTGGLAGDNVESLLPIVASQRERFKVRNMELEAVGSPIGCTNFVSFFVGLFLSKGTLLFAGIGNEG